VSERNDSSLFRFLAALGLLLAAAGIVFLYKNHQREMAVEDAKVAVLLEEIRKLEAGAPGALGGTWIDLEPFDLPRQAGLAEELRKKTELAYHLRPRDLDAICYRGVYIQRAGEVRRAIAYYGRAISLYQDSVKGHILLSTAYRRNGQLDEAMTQARTAITMAPGDAAAHDSLGSILAEKQKWAEAAAEYRTAIERDPAFFPAYNNLGFALLRQGKPAEAIDSFRRALRLNPRSAVALTNWGRALEEQGKTDEAIERYRKATEIDPGYADGRIALADALLDQGKMPEALEQYKIARQLRPDLGKKKRSGQTSVSLVP
jgi:tetratricopeptide (TPR) repeat protein